MVVSLIVHYKDVRIYDYSSLILQLILIPKCTTIRINPFPIMRDVFDHLLRGFSGRRDGCNDDNATTI